MKILDVLENDGFDKLDVQIKEFTYAIKNFNNLVDLFGYNKAVVDAQNKINLSKSVDWYYKILSLSDKNIKMRYEHLLKIRNKLEKLINTGLSYE